MTELEKLCEAFLESDGPTGGPWHIEAPSKGSPCHTVKGGETNAEIAYVHAGEASQEANARLIAAAPELLVACKAMYDLLTRDFGQLGPTTDAAFAAIAKATGEGV